MTIFYRLARVVDSCQTVTVRNTGGSSLTGLGAQLSGAGASFFTLDTSSTATTLDPNETTTLQVCFSAVDTDTEAHFATLTVFSDNALPVSMHLLGDNAPEPIVFVPPLEFVSGGLLPSTEIEPVRFAGTVSGQAGATVILEGSRDIDISDPWTEIARVTLDALGNGAILEVPAPGTIGLPRYFFQLRTLTP